MDIQVGDRITYKNMNTNQINIELVNCESDVLDLQDESCFKILKIERPKYEVIEEKKELLTEEEKEFFKTIYKNN